MPKYVQLPEFRTHEQMRVEVNSSIMALLAGSQMANHMLRLTEGSDHLLSEVFPSIPHIRRLNLKTSAAQEVLNAAEAHASAMALPYILAVHEDYMKSSLALIETYCNPNLRAEDIKSYEQHEKLQEQSGQAFSQYALEQFHLSRLIRNCMIHSGGEISKQLENRCNRMPLEAKSGWETLTGYTPAFRVGQPKIRLTHREIVAALAITKRLARETNLILQDAIDKSAWSRIMLDDFTTYGPGFPKNSSERIRKLSGYARYRYSVLEFTASDIEAIVNGLELGTR